MNTKLINNFIEIREIREIPEKGYGVFAIKNIPISTKVYNKIYKETLEYILQINDENIIQKNISLELQEDNIFIYPVGIESYINHNDNPNMKSNISCKEILAGEELTENYSEFDNLEHWYFKLTKKYILWVKERNNKIDY
jgi:hypothetical protein